MDKPLDKGILHLLGASAAKRKRGAAARNSGYQVEHLAQQYLVANNVSIVASNHRCRQGEVDIIGNHNGQILFIEVRFRSNARYASAAESVDYRKQQKVIVAAQDFLARHPELQLLPSRFDVIAAGKDSAGNFSFEWIQDAFQVN